MRRALPVACAVALGVVLAAVLRAQAPPTFRAGVDVIQLNVGVLDKNRRPIRGLTPADFTVLENGQPQHIVGVIPMDATQIDPQPSAWMRRVVPDIAINNLADTLGTGRLFAILVDDRNLPWDDDNLSIDVRQTMRHLIDDLGPSDTAALVYAEDAGGSQDFTTDRAKLLTAVDAYSPHRPAMVYDVPQVRGPIVGDAVPFDPAIARSPCQRDQPAVPALETLVARMAAVHAPRRKTVVYVGVGVPMRFDVSTQCEMEMFKLMRDAFSEAAHGDVMIHTIDPLGYEGYSDYLANPMRTVRGTGASDIRGGFKARGTNSQHDFLKIVSDNTGGRAVIDTDDVVGETDRLFAEDASYYLVGYETSNPQTDGKFRKVQVRVGRPGVTVHALTGYWAAGGDDRTPSEAKDSPPSLALGLSGLGSPAGLPLRAEVVPFDLAALPGGAPGVKVAAILTTRVSALGEATDETLTTIRNVYDVGGRAGAPTEETNHVHLDPAGTDEQRYDVVSSWTLAPGRYQVRFNAHSAIADRAGTVYADVDVPDFAHAPLALTPIVLGHRVDGTRTDPLAASWPVVPTTDREFAPTDALTAFARVFEGGDAPIAPAVVAVEVLDAADTVRFQTEHTVASDAFGPHRFADCLFDLPLARLVDGPYVLNVSVTAGAAPSARQDLVFRVRPGVN